MTKRRLIGARITVSMLLATLSFFSVTTPVAAGSVRYRAVDQVSDSFEIPITGAVDHVTWPSVLLVASATLTTSNPNGSGVQAPPGSIYLSVQWSSAPINLPITNPNWGNYFSNITPIPASAVSYWASGHRYDAVRIDAVDQTYSMGPQDGLVDATYYFIVPMSNRQGSIVISPCRSIGTEYENASGMNTGVVNVGGPTRIPVSFPAQLTQFGGTNARSTVGSGSVDKFGSSFYVVLTLLLGGVIVFASAKARKRPIPVASSSQPSRSPSNAPPRPNRPRASDCASGVTAPRARPNTATLTAPAFVAQREHAAEPPTARIDEPNTTQLSVDVLGPLTIVPTFTSPSDPVRAVVAYLALHDQRPITLDEIQTALWPISNDSAVDIKRSSMGNYMTDARKYIGAAHLPSAAGQPGYRLVDVDCDWRRFQELVTQSLSKQADESRDLRRQALGLVRGQPLAGDTSRYFTWAFSMTVIYQMVSHVVDTAHELSRDYVLAGDLSGAEATLRQGLLIDPASTTLWEDLTDVVLESADPSLLSMHWRAAEAVLGKPAVVALQSRANG